MKLLTTSCRGRGVALDSCVHEIVACVVDELGLTRDSSLLLGLFSGLLFTLKSFLLLINYNQEVSIVIYTKFVHSPFCCARAVSLVLRRSRPKARLCDSEGDIRFNEILKSWRRELRTC